MKEVIAKFTGGRRDVESAKVDQYVADLEAPCKVAAKALARARLAEKRASSGTDCDAQFSKRQPQLNGGADVCTGQKPEVPTNRVLLPLK